jgi:hypothetical protein
MNSSEFCTIIDACRSCGSSDLMDVLDLGVTPLADRLLTSDTLHEAEPTCALTVVFCNDCSLIQIRETVDQRVLYGSDYTYYSSESPSLLAQFRASEDED